MIKKKLYSDDNPKSFHIFVFIATSGCTTMRGHVLWLDGETLQIENIIINGESINQQFLTGTLLYRVHET